MVWGVGWQCPKVPSVPEATPSSHVLTHSPSQVALRSFSVPGRAQRTAPCPGGVSRPKGEAAPEHSKGTHGRNWNGGSLGGGIRVAGSLGLGEASALAGVPGEGSEAVVGASHTQRGVCRLRRRGLPQLQG